MGGTNQLDCVVMPHYSFLSKRIKWIFFPYPTCQNLMSPKQAPASLALEGGENLWRQMLDAMGGPYAELARVPHGNSWAQIGARNLPSDWP